MGLNSVCAQCNPSSHTGRPLGGTRIRTPTVLSPESSLLAFGRLICVFDFMVSIIFLKTKSRILFFKNQIR